MSFDPVRKIGAQVGQIGVGERRVGGGRKLSDATKQAIRRQSRLTDPSVTRDEKGFVSSVSDRFGGEDVAVGVRRDEQIVSDETV